MKRSPLNRRSKKKKQGRLYGDDIRILNDEIHDRDNHCCICCEAYVDEGVKFHHEPPKSQGGQDLLENGVLLCYSCHNERHFGDNSQKVKEHCINYLKMLYG